MCWFAGDKRGEELLQRLRLSKGGEGAVYRGAGRGSGGRGEGKKGEKWRLSRNSSVAKEMKKKVAR